MARFQIYRNSRPTKRDVPFLLDVQSDFVKTPSRVVVPLVRADRYGPTYGHLNPTLTVDGVLVVASFSDIAAIESRELSKPVADASNRHAEWIAALDFLFAGI
jgi:toxin CcdB